MSAWWSTQTETSGGWSDTDARLLAVMPAAGRRAADRDHGDAGGEAAEQLAEPGGVDVRRAQRTILARNSGLSTRRAGTKSPVTPTSVSAMPGRRPSRPTARSKRAGNSMP